MFSAIKTIDAFSCPPDSGGTARAFSCVGYDLSEALADLIDNSIDASASRIAITLFRNDRAITTVTIADDGRGMAKTKLKGAMQFGCSVPHKASDLGTFGVGLKSASFSQCRSLTVITRYKGTIAACRWTVEAIEDDWRCDVLDPGDAAVAFSNGFLPNAAPSDSGTLVIWERLDRLATGAGQGDLEEFLADQISELEAKLGLIFHRFLQRPNFTIHLQTRHEARPTTFPRAIRALDPFGYAISGKLGYPKTFHTTLPGDSELELRAHVWPAKVTSPEFLLGRGSAAEHQGFYFFRNDRLIQAGGWNDLLAGNEPELSLARVAIDLPVGGTRTTIQKSAIQVTAALSQALHQARSGSASLDDYLEDARNTFRAAKRIARPHATAPVVLGAGVPAQLRRKVKSLVARTGVVREIAFAWEDLSDDTLFEVDRVDDRIVLNKRFRKRVLTPAAASKADAAFVKALLFLLLYEDFDRSRFSAKRRDWFTQCNAILLEALKSL